MLSYDVVHNMEPEPCSALVAARGEERIECMVLDGLRHTFSIVGKNDFYLVFIWLARLDRNASAEQFIKSVLYRIEEQIGFRQLRTCRRTRPGQLCAH